MQLVSVDGWLETLGVDDPSLRRFAAYWESRRGARLMPQRADIEPWEIKELLGRIWMWSFDRARRTFFLRLAGEEILNVLGHHRRGTALADMMPASVRESIHRRYLEVAERPAAAYFAGTATLASGVSIPARRLVLPLGDAWQQTSDIIGVSVYDWRVPPADKEPASFADEAVDGTYLPLSGGAPPSA